MVLCNFASCLGTKFKIIIYRKRMKLSKFKDFINAIPADYNDFTVAACPSTGTYDLDNYIIDYNNKVITLES